jgi:hypothetical protein
VRGFTVLCCRAAAAILNKTRDPVRDKVGSGFDSVVATGGLINVTLVTQIQCLLYEAIDKSGGLRQAQLAIQIEDSMHRAFGHTGKEYKSKFRDVVFHLKVSPPSWNRVRCARCFCSQWL